jgi:hypothetical protein
VTCLLCNKKIVIFFTFFNIFAVFLKRHKLQFTYNIENIALKNCLFSGIQGPVTGGKGGGGGGVGGV